MLRAGLRLAKLLCAVLVTGAAPVTALAQEAQTEAPSAVVKSPVLTIDRERLYAETLYGKAVEARFKADSDALVAENLRLEQALEAEERELTDRRATLPPQEFKALAAAFDAKAEQIRAAQEAKSRAIGKKREAEQQRFLEAAIPVLGELMRASGAAAIFDKNMIILSLRGIEITDEAIARIDTVLGDGSAPAQQKPQAAPAEPSPKP